MLGVKNRDQSRYERTSGEVSKRRGEEEISEQPEEKMNSLNEFKSIVITLDESILYLIISKDL